MTDVWADVDAKLAAHKRELDETKSAIDRIPASGGKWTFRGVNALGKWRATHRHHGPIEAKSGAELVQAVVEFEERHKPKRSGTQ